MRAPEETRPATGRTACACPQEPASSFIGEVGVTRRLPHVCDRFGLLDDDYDRDNPPGTLYGRRHRGGSAYLSGSSTLAGQAAYSRDGH